MYQDMVDMMDEVNKQKFWETLPQRRKYWADKIEESGS